MQKHEKYEHVNDLPAWARGPVRIPRFIFTGNCSPLPPVGYGKTHGFPLPAFARTGFAGMTGEWHPAYCLSFPRRRESMGLNMTADG